MLFRSVIIDSPFGSESGFGHIFGSHRDLVIPRETIHERQQGISRHVIHQDINVRERKVIPRAFRVYLHRTMQTPLEIP